MKHYLDSKPIFYNNSREFYEENDEVKKKINSFSLLPVGWNYGEGKLIEQPVISKAIELYTFGKVNGFNADAFPMVDGGINLSFYINEHALDVVINKDNLKIDIEYQKGLGQDYEIIDEIGNADYADIYSLLNEIRTAWLLSESYQSLNTTIERLKDFRAIHLETLQEVVFPLWTSSALKMQLPMDYANTYNTSMSE